MLQIKLLLGDARRVLKESFCECVVLTLDSFVFLSADRDVERAGTDTDCIPLLRLLVRSGTVNGRPLALANVYQFVEQDSVFAIQIDVFLCKITIL